MTEFEPLRRMFPHAQKTWMDALITVAPSYCAQYGITTKRRWRHFLGQIGAESSGLHFVKENLNYDAAGLIRMFHSSVTPAEAQELAHKPEAIANHVYGPHTDVGRMLGNTKPGDGAKYIGRGPIQLTGKANYAKYGPIIGEDLIANPEQLEKPEIGLKATFAYWSTRGCNAAADANDVVAVTRMVNGGLNGLDARRRFTAAAERLWPGDGDLLGASPVPTLPPIAPPVAAPSPLPPVTPMDVANQSRTFRTMRTQFWIWAATMIGTIGSYCSDYLAGLIHSFGLDSPDAAARLLSADKINATKDFLHAAQGLVVYIWPAAVLAFYGLFGALLLRGAYTFLDAVNSGRYVARGGVAVSTGLRGSEPAG